MTASRKKPWIVVFFEPMDFGNPRLEPKDHRHAESFATEHEAAQYARRTAAWAHNGDAAVFGPAGAEGARDG